VNPALSADVSEGVRQLEDAFQDRVSYEPDGQGGAYITIADIVLGDAWNVFSAPLTFHLAYNYPAAAPYPFYLPGGTEPKSTWPAALQRVGWRERAVLQVSLRHNNWDPARDSAIGSVLQVGDWLRAL
jgi:hypothetical protein